MEKISNYSKYYFDGYSFRSNEVNDLLELECDLIILISSWEERCLSIKSCTKINAKYGLLILFSNKDNLGLRERHDKILKTYIKRITLEYEIISEWTSYDIYNVWDKIFTYMKNVINRLRRPIKILFDMSSCPKFYPLSTLSTSLTNGLASRFSIFYSEGKYPPQNNNIEIQFTGHLWRTTPIVSQEGIEDPGKKTYYLVSVGFEGYKTLRAVSRADPDRVSILFPDPGFSDAYPVRTEQNNKDLFIKYRIPGEQIIRAPAGDAIHAWKDINKKALERDDENCYYLCCGTKPHSLALALNAICLQHPVLLYNVPDEHKYINVKTNGVFWRYDIFDRSIL